MNQVPPGQAQFPPMGQVSQGISQQGNPLDLIRQYHPDLGDHIEQYVQQGQSPIAAAALAKRSGYFNDVIKSIEKSEKMNFVDWVADIFGLPKVEGKQIATQGPQAGPAGMRGQAAQPGPTAPQGHPELLRLLGQASQFMANYRGRT
ncbi:MAG TPA: hypothetical protein DCP92_16615 [Nitrospiraceae bacterium]|nr:hypothetical protein [Nitrospiraceae bacterium]